jgi:hypothetical protein
MIVPLGSWYLELISVVDEAEARASARGRRVADAIAAGRTFVTWAMRASDLDLLQHELRRGHGLAVSEIRPGSRRTPDGRLLRWRTLELGDGALPFVIEWDVAESDHPGRALAADATDIHGRPTLLLESDDASARALLDQLVDESVTLEWSDGAFNGIRALAFGSVRMNEPG